MSKRWLFSGLLLCLCAIPAFSQVTQKVFSLSFTHRELANGTIDPVLCPNPPDCHAKPEVGFDAGYTGVFKEGSYVGKNSGGGTVEFMNWRMVYPTGYNPGNPAKYPMIIMLHGAGEGGRVWTNNFDYGPTHPNRDNNSRNIIHGGERHRDAVVRNPSLSNSFPGIVIWPQVSYNGAWESGWENGNQSDNTRMAAEIVEYMIRERNVDPDRIAIHGLSNGAQGVWDLAAKRPDLFASVLPMSGLGTNLPAMVDILVTTPIWIFQGGTDGNPNPSGSLDWTNAFNNAGGNMLRTLYPGQGHGIWGLAYDEPNFFPYIKAASKKNVHVFGGTPSVCPGGQLRLGFSANFLAYQWTKDGVDIPGATSRFYSIAHGGGGGTYRVKYQRRTNSTWDISNPVNVTETVSSPYTPVLTNTGSPYIPVNITGTTPLPSVKNFVYLNAPAGFTSYQWYKNGNLVATTASNQRLVSQDAGSSGDAGTYTVKVVSGCVSNFSNPITLVWNSPQPTSPQPAKASTVTLSETSLRVNWTDYANEISYELWRYRHSSIYNSEQPWTQVATLPVNTTTFVDTGLRPEGFYKYSVRAILANGSAIMSPEGPDSWGRPLADNIPPTAPTGLIASNISGEGLTLSWTASTDNDMVYQYEVYSGPTLLKTVTGTTTGTPAVNTVSLTGLTEQTTYFLNVRAKDFKGNYSAFAEGVSVTTTVGYIAGLDYKYYLLSGTMPGTAGAQLVEPRANNSFNFAGIAPNATGTVSTFSIAPRTRDDNFVFAFDGYIDIQTIGTYTFYTSSDDGSRLYINGTPVVDNDGAHSNQERNGTYNFTNTGKFPIRVTFFEQTGEHILTVSYSATGITKTTIPANVLFRPGSSFSNYYSGTSGALDDVNSWWSNSNGTGSHPTNFTTALTNYHIVNRSSASISNAWTVTGNGSKVIVGSGSAITLDINAAFTGTMSASELATINVNTATIPTFNVLAANSTVNFNPGTNITIPNAMYGNLSLGGSNQYTIGAANTMIQGNLSVANGATTTGAPTNLSRLVIAGDVTFANSSNPLPGTPANQYALVFTGGRTHTVSFNTAVDPSFFSIQTDVGDVVNFVNGSARTYTVGSSQGGGIVNKGTINLGNNNLVVSGRGGINSNNETGAISVNGGSITLNSTGTLNSNLSLDATNNILTNLSLSVPSTFNVNLLTPAVVNNLVSVSGGGNIVTGDGNLKLTSTLSNTARLGPLGNGSRVSGSIRAQRFMEGEGKIYRYISMPVKGVRVADLQPFIPVTGDFTGADVIAGNTSSMFSYTEASGYQQFPAVGGTNQDTLRMGRGYSIYVREETNPTIWEVKGAPNQGTVTYALSPGSTPTNGYSLLGNPYPAPIKWSGGSTGGWTMSGVNSTVSIRENKSDGSFQWRTWNGTTGNNPGGIIAIGQAFWVQATNASPSLAVTETAKQTTDGAFYRAGDPENVIAVKLKNGTREDDTYIQFARGATPAYEKELDAAKLSNSFFNLSTLTADGKAVAINLTTTGQCDQTVSFRIANATNGSYQLILNGVENLLANDEVIFTDAFLGTDVTLTGEYTHNFSITADAASKADGRFKLKFIKPDVTLDNSLVAEAGCNDGNPLVIVNQSQPGVDYTAFVDGTAVSEPFVGTGGDLAVAIDHAKIPYGKTNIKLKAGFIGCSQGDLVNNVNVNRDTVELPTLVMNDGKLSVSNVYSAVSYQWIHDGEILDVTTSDLTPTDAGLYQVQITKASCVLTSNEIEKKTLDLDIALSSNEACSDDAIVTLEETQPGATYQAYVGNTAASLAVVGTGVPIEITLNPEVVSGTKEVSIRAVFENDVPQFLAQKVMVERVSLPVITEVDGVLKTEDQQATYTWYFNGQPIDSNSSTIEPKESGSYYVQVSNGVCTQQSAPVNYAVTGVGEFDEAYVAVSPNPTRSKVVVVAGKSIQTAAVRLTSALGQAFRVPVSPISDRSVELDVSELSTGFYLVHVNGQVIRLVKE